jgi:hypothetical protein
MNLDSAKNEFHSKANSNFDEVDIANCIVDKSDRIVGGDGYEPISDFAL